MKKIIWISLLLLGTGSVAPAQPSVSFDMFYSSLSPSGEWIAIDGGTYGWRPAGVAADWRPYSEGHWVWTDDGWYWDSDESWGWATYHYGRWYYDDYYGWVWVPGYEWAPAWVEWRYGGTCIGWAPLSPYAVFSFSWGIHYRRYWSTPYNYWSFVDCRYMGQPKIGRYVYRNQDNVRYIGRTRTAGSVRYDNGRIVTRGPDREFVERNGNMRLNRTEIVDVRDRGQAGIMRDGNRERIGVYRPTIRPTENVQGPERPERIRMDERRIGLDIRGTDIRRREVDAAAGRDIRRAEDMRRSEENSRAREDGPAVSAPSTRPSNPSVQPSRPSGRSPVEINRPTPRPSTPSVQPNRPSGRAPVEMNRPSTTRPSGVDRPQQRTERPSGARSGASPQVRRETPRPSRESAPAHRNAPASKGGGERRGGRR